MDEEYILIVNGSQKPWPTDNYIDNPVTIDLNWGLDTNSYEAEVVTFTLKDLIAGQQVKNVHFNAIRKEVICTIPIVEKTQKYRLIIDWTPVKEQVRDGLSVVVNGKSQRLHNGLLILRGKDVSAKFKILYHGKTCYIKKESDDIIHVTLPSYKYKVISWKRLSLIDWMQVLAPGVLLSCLILLLLWGININTLNENDDRLPQTLSPVKDDVFVDEKKVKEDIEITNREARKYLSTHNFWVREEMVSISPKLGNLYDALNSFHFTEVMMILEEFNVQNESIELEELCDYIRFAESHKRERRGKYSLNDTISLSSYKRFIFGRVKERNHQGSSMSRPR